jgi:hypothetical protein|nr:MAG TPA_asm: hypothetical protein [Caudoviricetes sp.]
MKIILADKTELECLRYKDTYNAEKYNENTGATGHMAWIGFSGDTDPTALAKAFTADNIKELTIETKDGKTKTFNFTKVDEIGLTATDYSDEYLVTLK